MLDESESLMNHFDEGTLNNKDVETLYFQRDNETREEGSINGR
ncbi:MAG: hypothetical protein ACKPKO_04240 [Candidatus Fonsibacter sp.]